MRGKRQKTFPRRRAGPTSTRLSIRRGGTILCPHCGWANVPTRSSVRPCSPAPHRLPIVLSKLSKLLNQEVALSAPWIFDRDLCSSQTLPTGRKNFADRRNPSLSMSHSRLLHPSHHAQALMLPVVGGICAGRVSRCAKLSRIVIKDGADGGGIYSHGSTVLGCRPEGYEIYLVTGVVLCCFSSGRAAGTPCETPVRYVTHFFLMPLS